jgi:hypothetical protein
MMKTPERSRIVWSVGVAVVLLLALGTRPAAGGGKDVTLYELTEEAQFSPDGAFRLATSSLEGKAKRGTPLCPEGLMAYAEALFATVGIHVQDASRCTIVAVGHSTISLATFGGEIHGDFAVVVNSDKTNLTDAPELVIMSGTFAGNIQVTDPAGVIITILPGADFTASSVLPGFPLPSAATFTGKFRLPFTLHHVAVYKKDNGQPVPVLPDERALGDPTVRVEVTFD